MHFIPTPSLDSNRDFEPWFMIVYFWLKEAKLFVKALIKTEIVTSRKALYTKFCRRVGAARLVFLGAKPPKFEQSLPQPMKKIAENIYHSYLRKGRIFFCLVSAAVLNWH